MKRGRTVGSFSGPERANAKPEHSCNHVIDVIVRTGPMTTIQNILFPVDFSPSCTALAVYVKRAAAIASAKVTLLYVLEPSTSSTSGFDLLARPLREVEEDRECVA